MKLLQTLKWKPKPNTPCIPELSNKPFNDATWEIDIKRAVNKVEYLLHVYRKPITLLAFQTAHYDTNDGYTYMYTSKHKRY